MSLSMPLALSQPVWEVNVAPYQDMGEFVGLPFDASNVTPMLRSIPTALEEVCPPTSRQQPYLPETKVVPCKEAKGAVRFFTFDHPAQLRNKSEMRKNRQHVMHDFLKKERLKPWSNDVRVNGNAVRRRKRVDLPQHGTSPNSAAPSNLFRRKAAPITPAAAQWSPSSDAPSSESEPLDCVPPLQVVTPDAVGGLIVNLSVPDARLDDPEVVCHDLALTPHFGQRLENERYLSTRPEDVPFTALQRLGAGLQPFNVWPNSPEVNVAKLKWSCSQLFASRGMAVEWVPTLLRARHAFLSTICISSAHVDIMRRASTPRHQKLQHESFERTRVRQEVIGLINQSMSDPQLRTADATLVAVLQVLYGEMMGCDDSVMRVHQTGLQEMIRHRGGLRALGMNGQLASNVTITMFMMAIQREALPHADFVRYAYSRQIPMPEDSRPLPESPIYCRSAGYVTIHKCILPQSRISKLLDATRRLSNAFYEQVAQRQTAARQPGLLFHHNGSPTETVLTLATEVLTFPPAADLVFRTVVERSRYEAIRLTCCVHAQALKDRLPFSEAAARLSMSMSSSKSALPIRPTAMHVRIRDALLQADTTAKCWGHMAGVLYWITLVAGAAGNPTTLAQRTPTEPDDAAEAEAEAKAEAKAEAETEAETEAEARKWLTAMSVRCAITLGFDFASPILETLRRMIGIQEVLRGARATDSYETADDTDRVTPLEAYCPSLPPAVQEVRRGFAEFARGFSFR